MFVLSRASDNTTSQNIRGTSAWAVPHLKFGGGRPPSPRPRSPPMIHSSSVFFPIIIFVFHYFSISLCPSCNLCRHMFLSLFLSYFLFLFLFLFLCLSVYVFMSLSLSFSIYLTLSEPVQRLGFS